MSAAVLRWYYNRRDKDFPEKELSAVFGPFPDAQKAKEWADKQETWGGWGEYKYQISEIYPPNEETVS